MSAALTYSLAPITLNSTTLATANLRVTPDVASKMDRNSGDEFPSVEAVLGGAPRVSFSTPFAEAYALIGLKTLPLTTFNVYLAKYVSAIRSASSVHAKYALAASASGFAYIKSLTARQNGVAMCDVEVVLVSADGTTHPLAPTTGALPSLGSQPALRTVGPCSVNGTTIAGVMGVSVDFGAEVEPMTNDGDLYPRVCSYLGGDPVITVEHGDPETLRGTLGFLGASVSANFVQYLRDVDTTTQVASTTGMSLTVASGRCIPAEWGADNLQIAKGGMRVECLSSSTTHPIAVATGASVPTP